MAGSTLMAFLSLENWTRPGPSAVLASSIERAAQIQTIFVHDIMELSSGAEQHAPGYQYLDTARQSLKSLNRQGTPDRIIVPHYWLLQVFETHCFIQWTIACDNGEDLVGRALQLAQQFIDSITKICHMTRQLAVSTVKCIRRCLSLRPSPQLQ